MRKKILALSVALAWTTAFAQNSNNNENVVNSFLNNQSINYLKSDSNQLNQTSPSTNTNKTNNVSLEPQMTSNIQQKEISKQPKEPLKEVKTTLKKVKESISTIKQTTKEEVKTPSPIKIEEKPLEKNKEEVKKPLVKQTESVECYPVEHKKKWIHHFYKKHILKKVHKVEEKPVVKAPVEKEIILVNQEKNVLVSTHNFFIPNVQDNNLKNWEKPLMYKDIQVQFEQNPKTKEISINLFNERNHVAVDSHQLVSINGKDVRLGVVKSDLSQSNEYSWNVENHWQYQAKNHTCSIMTVSYQLFGQKESQQVTRYIDNNANLSDSLPDSCAKNQKDLRETTFYTNQDNVVDVSLNQHKLDENQFALNEHFVNDGQDFFPNNLKTYLIKTDLSVVYILNPENNPKGPYFGVNYFGSYPKGNYYLVSTFGSDNNMDHIKTEISIK
jgi:hypothetical protein